MLAWITVLAVFGVATLAALGGATSFVIALLQKLTNKRYV